MSKLNVDQKTVFHLFSDKRSDFLIPDYQRPYAWTEDQCSTLWEDIFSFAIPDNNANAFDESDEYFLGPIVTFRNDQGRLEIIDGQQRLTTLMLLLRAFYSKFEHMQDEQAKKTRERIAECIWKTDEFGEPDKNRLKIDSEVASDDDKAEFLHILRVGEASAQQKSRYAKTFRFFQDKIKDFIDHYPSYTAKLAIRVLKNLILLPIEAESQRTALRIFSTLNDRGLPLADADIFKSQLYKTFDSLQRKDEFIKRWRELEDGAQKAFATARALPMDELFSRYMFYVRALQGKSDTTTEALRDFYERENYKLLREPEILDDLEALLEFWKKVDQQDGFSEETLRDMFVLAYAPNSMWTFFLSVYYMHHRDSEGNLDDEKLRSVIRKLIGLTWTYSIVQPGVSHLRTPMFKEMVKVVHNGDVTFELFSFDRAALAHTLESFTFSHNRPITRSMLVWWAFQDPEQKLFSFSKPLEVEHIYSRRRADVEKTLTTPELVEALGNKAILEKHVNIRASDYRFEDKKKCYKGFTTQSGQYKEGTRVHELLKMAETLNDFQEAEILNRHKRILAAFIEYLDEVGLVKD